MAGFILLTIASGIFFIFFFLCIIIGLTKRRRGLIIYSIVLFLGGTFCGCLALYIGMTKGYKKVSRISETFKPRSGIEIYTAVFGKPIENCVDVAEKMDQVVPRLDCCIWLKFATCLAEIKRISLQFALPTKNYLKKDSFMVSYAPKPDWWLPQQLGDSIRVLQNFDVRDPNHDRILVISKDSTKGLYCDMAD
jgi:hypothetical protein